MATGWVKSLQCKSNAVDDVVFSTTASSSSKKSLLSCANSSHAVKDAVFVFPKCPSHPPSASSKKPLPKQKPKSHRPAPSPPSPPAAGLAGPSPHPHTFPTLAELPAGHSSRRVVEIIFSSSWSSSPGAAAFPGEIEILFRVRNPARTVARFEEHRAAVRARAEGDARCSADGNEMMRFHCGGGGGGGGVYDSGMAPGAVWSAGGKVEGIRTFAGSGGAHASGGGGAGRRAMLVCRVIAGRVRDDSDPESEAESVRLGKGELVVLDPIAVLPCFLIIYKI